MAYTDEKKDELIRKFCELVATTDKSIDAICREDLGGIWARSIRRKWVTEKEEWKELVENACSQRAYRYQDEALRLAKDLEQNWKWRAEGCYAGKDFFEEKERTSAVNVARFAAERLDRHSANLAPDEFGDNAKEIKEIQKSLDEIKKKLER